MTEVMQYGSSAKTSEDTSGVPVLRMGNIQDGKLDLESLKYLPHDHAEFPELLLKDGDLLFNRTNSAELVGKSAVYRGNPAKCSCASYLIRVRLKPEFVPEYLCNYLNSPFGRQWIASVVSQQVGQANVNGSKLKALRVPVPGFDDQRRIVEEIEKQFTRLEAGVAALRRAQANLKRYRAAVLKSACEGRLVPSEAELARTEGRPFESGQQLLARILTERRQNWQGRGQYKEPDKPAPSKFSAPREGWAWATVEQLSSRVQYGSSAKTNEDSNGVPVLRMGNIQEGKFDHEKLKYLPQKHHEFPELLLTKGDVLFNRTNSADLVGKTAVYKDAPSPCSFASYLIRVQLVSGCLPDFLSFFINSVFGRAWIGEVVSQQVGQANVNGTKLQALSVPLPPLAEQIRIVEEVERRLSVVEELEAVVIANLQRATRLRQSILARAFSSNKEQRQ